MQASQSLSTSYRMVSWRNKICGFFGLHHQYLSGYLYPIWHHKSHGSFSHIMGLLVDPNCLAALGCQPLLQPCDGVEGWSMNVYKSHGWWPLDAQDVAMFLELLFFQKFKATFLSLFIIFCGFNTWILGELWSNISRNRQGHQELGQISLKSSKSDASWHLLRGFWRISYQKFAKLSSI